MRTLNDISELGDVLEPYDPNYISKKPYEIPDLSSYEKRFIHKVSIIEKKLIRNRIRFEWLHHKGCFRLSKYFNSDYPTYRYIYINMDENDYSFGTENEDLVYDGHASVVIAAAIDWLQNGKPYVKVTPGWHILPLGYHPGFSPVICKTKREASEKLRSLKKSVDFELRIVKR